MGKARSANREVIRDNHYVPIWYQRGFMNAGAAKYDYLDRAPKHREFAPGRLEKTRPLSSYGPKRCFQTLDLYTTRFGEVINDEVERYLFGEIDRRGALAVRAMISGDHVAIHDSFSAFFEYIDAQKLRTPKGLDWVRSQYPELSQVDLMVEMQGLRKMNCTMWSECVREIVSAETSDVKFIVTDHPVTVYNPAFPPNAAENDYPADPSIELIGSQTIFALDANHCLILTNLEYAKDPSNAALTRPRTHARYRGGSLVRTDAFIRKRQLVRDEVIAINFLLKSRSCRFIAGADAEWLYPDRAFKGTWTDLAPTLLPRHDLWQFGGEIYIGYKDGSTAYQDAFGRTTTAHEYLARKAPPKHPGPSDACGCGSGHEFKQCCQLLNESDRPRWDIYGIRERNLMFSHATQEILGLLSGKSWRDVRTDLSDGQVREIHEVYGSLWPPDTDLSDLLPRPRNDVTRALFLGIVDPRTVAESIAGWLPYFNEIIVTHPFINPVNIRNEFSPTKAPAQHKAQLLKNVALLITLEPYIKAGVVHLIPDPTDLSLEFTHTVLSMARSRTRGWKPSVHDPERLRELARDDYVRSLTGLPTASLQSVMTKALPEINEEMAGKLVEYLKAQREDDPYALLQDLPVGESGAQSIIAKGFSLESGLYLASLTGAVIFTDSPAHWYQLHEHTTAGGSPVDDTWKPVVEAMNSIEFLVEPDLDKALQWRSQGRSGELRCAISQTVGAIQAGVDLQPEACAHNLLSAATAMRKEWGPSASPTRQEWRLQLSVPRGHFDRLELRRLLATFGRGRPFRIVRMAMLITQRKADGTEII